MHGFNRFMVLVTGITLPFLAAQGRVQAQDGPHQVLRQYEDQRPRGTSLRYERVRELARRLDEQAQGALREARTPTRRGNGNGNDRDARFFANLEHFANEAHQLRVRFDQNSEGTFSALRTDLNALVEEAERLNTRMRRQGVFVAAHDEMSAAVDSLQRMQRVASGGSLAFGKVPATTRQDPWFGRRQDTSSLRPDDVREFRRLSRDLAVTADRVRNLANDRGYRRQNQRSFEQVEHFATQAREIEREVAADPNLDVREAQASVRHLLDDARAAEAELQRSRVQPAVQDEWSGVMRILDSMERIASRA
jgi:hypothetical protein